MFGAHSKFAQALVVFCRAALVLGPAGLCFGQGATPTQTTLNLSSASVQIGTTVTLTANVTSGSAPVYPGLVIFCNASAPYCEDSAILGQAQLTPNGTAITHLRLGVGSYNVKATFQGVGHTSMHSSTLRQASSSVAKLLTVQSPTALPSSTTLNVAGGSGAFQLTGTVITAGKPIAGGTVSFVDLANGQSSLGTLPLSSGKPGLQLNLSASVGLDAIQSASGDLNGDGIPDLVNTFYQDFVNILLGKGDGTFRNGQQSATFDHGAGAVTIADFNSDGILDIAVGDPSDNPGKVSILLGKGDGTFIWKSDLPSGVGSTSLISRDFDSDGIPDLAVLSQYDSTVTVALGSGDGTFYSAKMIALDGEPAIANFGETYFALMSADFNHDGSLDLAVAVNHGSNSASVDLLLGAGDGTFTLTPFPLEVQSPGVIASADFNGDGLPDLAISDLNTDTVTCLLGDVHGSFTVLSPLTSGTRFLEGVTAADFNGDGIPDLAVFGTFENIPILYGKGDGTFAEGTKGQELVTYTHSLTVADFNGDGVPDFNVIYDYAYSSEILLSEPTHTFSLGISLPGGGQHSLVASYSGDNSYRSSSSTPLAVQNVTATPAIFPRSGSYAAPKKITITDATPGAVIHYILNANGTPPGISKLYTGPFYVQETSTQGGVVETFVSIDATAVAPGYLPSAIAETFVQLAAPSRTVLGIAPGNSVEVGTPVTLAAHVTGDPLFHQGVVLFCNAAAAHCEGSAILGSAQLVAGGWATLRLQLGVGTYSIRAVFQGTPTRSLSSYPLNYYYPYGSSASEAQTLIIRGKSATSTGVVKAEQENGTYNFGSQVTVFGKA